MQLLQQLAQQTTDHDLQMRCYTRLQYLRDASHPAVAATPVAGAAGGPVQGQLVSSAPRPATPPLQTSGAGYLRARASG